MPNTQPATTDRLASEIQSLKANVATLADLNASLGEKLTISFSRLHTEELAQISKQIEGLDERLSSLEKTVEATAIRQQAIADFTDDVIGTSNNAIAAADSSLAYTDNALTAFLTAFLFLLTVMITAAVVWAQRSREEHIAEVRKSFDSELQDRINNIEKHFMDKLESDEDFLNAIVREVSRSPAFKRLENALVSSIDVQSTEDEKGPEDVETINSLLNTGKPDA